MLIGSALIARENWLVGLHNAPQLNHPRKLTLENSRKFYLVFVAATTVMMVVVYMLFPKVIHKL